MAKITNLELGLLVGVTIFMIFAAVNVNQSLGFTFAIMSIASGLFIALDPNRTVPLRKPSNSWFGSLFGGVLGYVALITIGGFVLVPGIEKLVALLQSTTPVLAANPQINFLIFSLAVPIIESTLFFGVLMDIGSNIFNVKINKQNLWNTKMWFLIFSISFLFMFFHLTSKGISAFATLGLVFFMAVISCFLTAYTESYEAAVYMHVIANTLALM